jgi:uncharacterized membrane protein YkoI
MIARLAIAAAIIALQGAPAFAAAQDERPALGAGQGDVARSARLIPLSKVIAMIQARTPGQYLNTTMGDQGGRPVYRIQWRMRDGRMAVFIVDAETGAMLGQEGG